MEPPGAAVRVHGAEAGAAAARPRAHGARRDAVVSEGVPPVEVNAEGGPPVGLGPGQDALRAVRGLLWLFIWRDARPDGGLMGGLTDLEKLATHESAAITKLAPEEVPPLVQ